MQTLEQQLQRFKLEMEGNSSGGLLLYVPEREQFVRISYGTGDNLSSEDIEEGYDDYLYLRGSFERVAFLGEDIRLLKNRGY